MTELLATFLAVYFIAAGIEQAELQKLLAPARGNSLREHQKPRT